MRAHRESVKIRTQSCSKDIMYIARSQLFRNLKMRAHRESQNSNTVMFERQNGHCAQPIISEFEGARTQRTSPDSNTVEFERQNEHCAQAIISQFDDARTQKVSSESNTVVIRAEIHAEDTDAQHIVHFEEARDFSDTGSLITQAPQSQSIHATINALSSWVSQGSRVDRPPQGRSSVPYHYKVMRN